MRLRLLTRSRLLNGEGRFFDPLALGCLFISLLMVFEGKLYSETPWGSANSKSDPSCEWASAPEASRSAIAEKAIDLSGKIYKRFPKGGDFQGTFTLLHFWATWCEPCVIELPQVNALVNRFKAKNLSVVAVSVDDDWESVNAFLGKWPEKPRFLSLLEPSRCWASYLGTDRFPETFLFGPDGKQIHRWIGAKVGSDSWNSSKMIDEIDRLIRIKSAKN